MIHMISAWASRQLLVLAQQAVGAESSDIMAIPAFLDKLDVQGCLVTIDAMGTRTDIMAQIRKLKVPTGRTYAPHVLTLKEDQPTLHEDVRDYAETLNPPTVDGRSLGSPRR